MRRLILMLTAAAVGGVGCAHQAKVAKDEVITTPAFPVEKKQVEVTPVAAAPTPSNDDLDKLEAILRQAQVRFAFNEDRLTAEGQQALTQVAAALKARRGVKVRIEGNCDERGTQEYNMVLGQRRADVARRYLVALGVDSGQVDEISYGAERPRDPGHSEEAWAKNRRDEVTPVGR